MFNELQPTIDNYNTVVLHVGANDLSRGSSVKTLLRKYQQLTSDIWHSNPTADIIISGVLPRADNQFPGALLRTNFLTELNQRARLLNTKLQLLATRVPRLHYVGHPSFAQKGTIQRHLLSRDGLHLSYRGTSTVVKDIESAIRHLRKTKDTHDSIWELPTSTPTSTPTPTPKAPTPMPDPTEPAVDQSLYRTALLTLPIRTPTPTPTPKPVLTSTGIQVIEEWPALPRVCYLVSSLINTSSTSNTVHVPTTTSSSVPACTISPNPVCVAPTSTSSRSPTSTSYRLSTSTSNRLPTSTSNRLPTSTSNRLPTSTSNRLSTSTSNRLPTSTSNRSPTSNRLPTSTSNRLPTSTSNRLPTSTSNRSPTSNRLPTSTSNRLPTSTSNRSPTIIALPEMISINLLVKLPDVQQQTNGYDCGVYAIANMVEYCHKEKLNTQRRTKFIEKYMRPHLISCLEKGHFTPFPQNTTSSTDFVRIFARRIECSCQCGKPDVFENMIGCEAKRGRISCTKWVHQTCSGVSEDWYCDEHRDA
ncbi:uncharacterized protein LOC127737165 [Mytilus californianus]|uniref:uncharacterized protein LOC127737165 n=1 Tax=Mytilus californianus TaxID=6549 RepID=UPI0022463019|nr:uncharacterized protein LOC127737165 [Mytilus californianus]